MAVYSSPASLRNISAGQRWSKGLAGEHGARRANQVLTDGFLGVPISHPMLGFDPVRLLGIHHRPDRRRSQGREPAGSRRDWTACRPAARGATVARNARTCRTSQKRGGLTVAVLGPRAASLDALISERPRKNMCRAIRLRSRGVDFRVSLLLVGRRLVFRSTRYGGPHSGRTDGRRR
jgi:hypothetical protein